MKKDRTRKGKDYLIDPATRRSRFIENNKAAMVHGGYSTEIPSPIVDALLDNDLGFELGILKGQLCNIATIGQKVIDNLMVEGEEASALSVELSCVDRSVKIIPQIQKVLESQITAVLPDNQKTNRARSRWLKQLYKGNCSPSDVAYQFEVHQLGELPQYVRYMLSKELSMQQTEIEHENLSREQILEKLEGYKTAVAAEVNDIRQRELAISIEKQRINQELFASSESVEEKS